MHLDSYFVLIMLRIQGQKFSPWWYCVDFKLWCRFWPCGKLSWSTCWRNLTRCAYDTSAAWALRLDAHFIRCILCFQSSRGAACGGTHSGVNLLFWARAHASYSKQGHCQRQTCFELVPDLITTWCQHLINMSTGRGSSTEQRCDGRRAISIPRQSKTHFQGKSTCSIAATRSAHAHYWEWSWMERDFVAAATSAKNPLTALNWWPNIAGAEQFVMSRCLNLM